MKADLMAVILGLAGLAVFFIYCIWKKKMTKAAMKQLSEEFSDKEAHDGQ